MHRLSGVTQAYEWGTTDEIPRLLGLEATGEPCAEYWLGAHPRGDARLDGEATLSQLVATDPTVLGEACADTFGQRLPFLFKVLSAAKPLSLQVHPNRKQAQDGYARETLMGIPLDAPHRNYRDDWPKPELLVAITPFDALVGFRDPQATASLFEALGVDGELASVIGPLRERTAVAAVQEVFLDVLSLGERRHLVDVVLAEAVRNLDAPGELGRFTRTAVEIDEHFPGDPSILAALMLNRVRLEPGEAISTRPGVMHAHLRGTGVEVMANSDNVLRGGLTRKHIDVDELLKVVDFTASSSEVLLPQGGDGVYVYPTSAPEFELWMLEPIDEHPLGLPRGDAGRICFVASGSFELATDDEVVALTQGESLFVPAHEAISATGRGRMFVAASGA